MGKDASADKHLSLCLLLWPRVLVPVKAVLPGLVQLLKAVLETLTGKPVLIFHFDIALLQSLDL